MAGPGGGKKAGAVRHAEQRLDSWKEIAAYMKQGVRTVQRWEELESLPIHRSGQKKRGTVYAYRKELDAWWSEREAQPERSVTINSRLLLAVGTSVLVLLALGIFFFRMPRVHREVRKLAYTQLTRDSGLSYQPAISKDGQFLVYASNRAGNSLDIWVQRMSGGEPTRLTEHSADDYRPAFSHDGASIVFRSDRDGGGIYTVLLYGGEPRLLADGGDFPRFSPDGQWLAYSTGNGIDNASVYLMSTDSSNPQKIDVGVQWAMCPAWSPDSKALLFQGSQGLLLQDESLDWWATPIEGREVVKTGAFEALRRFDDTLELTDSCPASWNTSPDRVLFAARAGDSESIWEIPISPETFKVTGPPSPLTEGLAQRQPAVAVDGRMVLANVHEQAQIWRLPLHVNDGKPAGEMERVTKTLAKNIHPTVSQDGTKMAFVSDRSGSFDVWIRDLVKGIENRLTFAQENDYRAAISPDGSQVAYVRHQKDNRAIYVIPSMGGRERKLCRHDCHSCHLMSWSSDGTKILYADLTEPIRFGTKDVSTRRKLNLIRHPRHRILSARFSGDDRWLSFKLAERAGLLGALFVAPVRNWVAVMNEEEWVQITNDHFAGRSWWSPDGRLLYFLSRRDGFGCIWAQRLEPTTKRPLRKPFAVAHFHGRRRIPRASGFGYGMTENALFFALWEKIGNIWMTTLETNRRAQGS